MLITIARYTIVFFGIFIFSCGLLMLFNPVKARQTLQKAGSTNFINYAEISLRMLPAAAMIIYAEFSRFPFIMNLFGWFMLLTSIILFFVPRQLHHNFSLKSAEILKPQYFQLIAPFAWAFGMIIIYSIT